MKGACSTALKIAQPKINVILTVLGAIAIPLPGFGVSLGIGELAAGRILQVGLEGLSGLVEKIAVEMDECC